MKNIFLLFGLVASLAGLAQNKEGRVVYERTMQMRRPQGMDPEMARRIPASRTDQFELMFTGNQTLWQVMPSAASEDVTVSSSSGNAVFRMGGMNNDIIFFDLEKGTRLDQREMFDRSFLIEDSVRRLNWKLTDETKTILNYTAKKAVAQRIGIRSMMAMENGEMKRQEVADTSQIIAWFTTEIPVASGPQEFQGQLPGLILELDVNNGRMVFKAIEVTPKPGVSIKEPKKGKRMSTTEFNKEREALMEEMRRNMPPGQNMRIIQQ